jgi:hypothetical protein
MLLYAVLPLHTVGKDDVEPTELVPPPVTTARGDSGAPDPDPQLDTHCATGTVGRVSK